MKTNILLDKYLNEELVVHCKICDDFEHEYDNLRSFGIHFARAHEKDITRAEYAEKFKTEEWVSCTHCEEFYFRKAHNNSAQYLEVSERTCGKEKCKTKDLAIVRKRKSEQFSLIVKKSHKEGKLHPEDVINNLRTNNPEKYQKYCEKLSVQTMKQIERDGAPYKKTRCGYLFNPFTKQLEYMMSSWEAAFAKWLQSFNVPYKKKNGLSFSYIKTNGRAGHHIPDFLLEESKELIELKGFEDENVSLKSEAAQKWCEENDFEYFLLKEAELSELGVLALTKHPFDIELERKI